MVELRGSFEMPGGLKSNRQHCLDTSQMQIDRQAARTKRNSFHGIVLPLVTPLLDRDVLDRAGLERLIEYVLTGGVHGLFLLGTTGEASALSSSLRREFVK